MIEKSYLKYCTDDIVQNLNLLCMVEDICFGKRQNPAFGIKIAITSKHRYFKGINQLFEGLFAMGRRSPPSVCITNVRF